MVFPAGNAYVQWQNDSFNPSEWLFVLTWNSPQFFFGGILPPNEFKYQVDYEIIH